ncbi:MULTISPECIES: restriction endonuclease subunit S [unclassified Mammaliicoccus]|uniref:restriction endonuclease subunit S n=1 Tax=unclassified Mammaliicoccus TaxID=2803851 RepID=UPI001EFAAB4C|nr:MULTISPECIES: restriction endonuclease subunit S [unclassified Mammaliicoccus]
MKYQMNPFKYKETNIDWIGNIPSHWDFKKMKYLASIITGNTPPKSDEENYKNGTYMWVKPDNFNVDYTISNTKEKLSEKGIELARIIPANSALVCSIGTVGKVAINKEPVTTNQQINSIIFDKKNWLNQYGTYAVIAAKSEFKKYSNKVVVSILNKTSQENIFMPLPKIYEQKIIGTFLDQKTSEIDVLITDKEKLITLLEEKRQATITEAVTKGLDPNVKMKDSGVEWISEIPEHWEVKRMKYLITLNPSKSECKLNPQETVTFAPMEKVLPSGVLDKSSSATVKEVYSGYTYFKDGDIIMAKVTPCFENGNIALSEDLINGVGFGTTELHVIRAKDNVSNEFLYYLLRSNTFIENGIPEMYGVAGLKRLPSNYIKNYRVALPSIEEQWTIVNKIREITHYINLSIINIQEQLSKLIEYRQSLIYEAVTGKIDIQEMEKETKQEEVASQ